MGQSIPGRAGLGGDCVQSAQGAGDLSARTQERSAGRADAGADRADGSRAALSRSPRERGSATGSVAHQVAGQSGACAGGFDQFVGIAWFRLDQWQLLRSVASDADILEQTHTEWESLAEQTIRDLARQGVHARKVDVDINELQAWCNSQQRPLDASARAVYAASQLSKQDE